jgi:telomerase reverse transcriptase
LQIGRDYYRQRTGIAQGSKLSSLLCALQYGALEHNKLGFATDDPARSLLMRYVDDSLFITTDRAKATEFLRVMDTGKSGPNIIPVRGLSAVAD